MIKKLLVIDDDAGIIQSVRAVMSLPPPVNIKLLDARSFDQGLALMRNEMPDICLLDLVMPPMNATETIEAMQAEMVDLAPILILTGHAEAEEWGYGKIWRQARMAGAVGFLNKETYLDLKNRRFLMHAINEAMLEFDIRKSRGIHFSLGHGRKT